MMMRWICALCAAVLLNWHCGPADRPGKTAAGEKVLPVVTVSILPQRFFVEKIAGDRVEVHVLIPPGQSPETYAPTPQQMEEIQRSRLYFQVGLLPLETAWKGKIADAYPGLTVVDTSTGVDLIAGDPHHTGHVHAGVDPHIWLSVAAVKIQCAHILAALLEVFPEERAHFQENYQRFMLELDRLDQEIRTRLSAHKDAAFMVFHPAWGYFARDYNLVQLAIEFEGKHPNPADMKRIVKEALIRKIGVIFVQSQFDTHSAEAVADEIGARVKILDPLALDWLTNMRETAAAIVEAAR